MRRGLPQQIAAGAIIVVVIVATAIAGVILSITDRPEGLLSAEQPTATVFHIPTLSPVPTLITVVIPTQTPVTTPTAAASSTLTPTRTPVGTITPIPTATPRHRTPTPDPSPGGVVAETCAVPSGWVPYTVQPGDNLFRVGLRYGETVGDLFDANCLSGAILEVGDTLYVPPVTPRALPTAASAAPAAPNAMSSPTGIVPTGTQTATDGACTNPDSTITAPPVGAILSGVVPIRGSALLPNFRFYKLEIREEGASTAADFVTFYTAEQQVDNGLLLNFDTRAWPNGQYWIRLVVVDDTGNYPERCAILYTITN